MFCVKESTITKACEGIHFSRNMSQSADTQVLTRQGDRVETFVWNMKVMDLFTAWDHPNEPSRNVFSNSEYQPQSWSPPPREQPP